MKSVIGLGFVALAGIAIGAGLAFAPAQAQPNKPHKITLCHGTASDTNPYVLITVDEHALKGHFDGTAPGHGKNNYPDFISIDGTCDIDDEEPGPS